MAQHGLAITALVALSLSACTKQTPLTVDELRQKSFATTLEVARELDDGPGFRAYLVAYTSSGLNVHAMVAVPDRPVPREGLPVIIANHGHVPDPARYGIGADGADARPGDYYRSVPELFTSRGFVVIMPDYRGHSSSEGVEFTRGDEAPGFYAEDVLALIAGLPDIAEADTNNVFMWSHSQGGQVSLRALLVTDAIKAASFWSTMAVDELLPHIDDLAAPVMIQHSTGDQSSPAESSKQLAAALEQAGLPYEFHTYGGSDHYFSGAARARAVDRDVAFFEALVD